MSWRDKQGPASFRGVKFWTETAERTGGRQTVAHEFPFSEAAPYTEDLGRKGRAFAVEGYVIGAEYTSARDALLTALEDSGPGELVHPFYGTRRVVVVTYRVRESRDAGGFAQFSIEFRETSAASPRPASVVDSAAALTTAATNAKAATSSAFLAAYTEALAIRDSVTGALNSATLAMGQILDRVAVGTQALASLRRKLQDVSGSAAALVSAPETLFDSLVGVFDALGDALLGAPSLVDPSGVLLGLFGFDPGNRPPDTTPNREVERSNFDATQALVQRLTLITAATTAVEQDFATYEDALRVRTAIAERIDEHTESVTDEAFPAFLALRSALVAAVPGEDSDLPKIQKHTPAVSVPSLVLAHQLYGNLDHEPEIVERNRVKNPGFLRAGQELEVLTRG